MELRALYLATLEACNPERLMRDLRAQGAGGGAQEIPRNVVAIGKCAVIKDPFGTRLCILDMTKGPRPLNLAESTRKDVNTNS